MRVVGLPAELDAERRPATRTRGGQRDLGVDNRYDGPVRALLEELGEDLGAVAGAPPPMLSATSTSTTGPPFVASARRTASSARPGPR